MMNSESADHHQDHEMPAPPKEGTKAAEAYFRSASSDFGLFHFIIDIVLKSDYFTFVAKRALDGSDDYKSVEPEQLARTHPGLLTKFLRKRRQVLLEMFLGRLVDNFQVFLVDLVRMVLHAKPAMLSTRQQTLTLEELLKYDRIEELVHDIIERRVNALTYEGFGELRSWCAERGLQIEVPAAHSDAVIELIATRNVIAHNRGVVDERYLRTVQNPRFGLGEVRKLEVDDLLSALALLHRIVAETDQCAAEKFRLPTGRLKPHASTTSTLSGVSSVDDEAVHNDPT